MQRLTNLTAIVEKPKPRASPPDFVRAPESALPAQQIAYVPPSEGRVLGASTDNLGTQNFATVQQLADLQAQVNTLANLPRPVFVPTFSGPAATTPVSTATFAQSQKIDQLSGTALSNIFVDGVSGLSDADIPDSLTASNYLPISGGTVAGDLTVTGDFTVSGAQTLSGAITIPYLVATSSSASTFAGKVGIGTSTPNSLLTIYAANDNSDTGDPTYRGDLRLISNSQNNGSENANGGVEFKPSGYQSGYGHRIFSPDLNGGTAPLVFQYRNNSATWKDAMIIDGRTVGGVTGIVGIGDAATTSTTWFYTETGYGSGQLTSLSPVGAVGILGASRTSDSNGGATIGGNFFALNDDSSTPSYAWGLYTEGRRFAGAKWTGAVEHDITNFGSVVSMDPYSQIYNNYGTVGAWIGSGGDCTASHPCWTPSGGAGTGISTTASLAIGIIANGSNYDKGIVFGYNALTGNDGNSGNASAIVMPKGDSIDWQYCDNTSGYPNNCTANILGASVVSDVNAATYASRIHFTNNGLDVEDITGTATWVQFKGTSADTNGFQFIPKSGSNGPILNPIGSGSDIPLNIFSKGSGDVILGGQGGSWALQVTPAASATNRIQVIAGATGVAPQIKGVGSDTNVPLSIAAQGSGSINLQPSGGLVGIGTTTPFWSLTAASSTGPQLALVDTTSSSYAWTLRSIANTLYIATSTATATSTTAALSISNNGIVTTGTNVVVGGNFLYLKGTGSNNFIYGDGNNLVLGIAADGAGVLQVKNSSNQVRAQIGTNGNSYFNPVGGNVGIGTTSPRTLLFGGTAANQFGLEPRTDGADIGGAGGANLVRLGGYYDGNPIPGAAISLAAQGAAGQRGAIGFSVKATDDSTNQPSYAMVINQSGNVGIGTTSPATTFSVGGKGYFTDKLGVGFNPAAIANIYNSGSGGQAGTLLKPDGIEVAQSSGVAAFFNRMTTTGDIIEFNYNGALNGSISTNGTNIAYNTSSDRRIKENIATTTIGLDALMHIPVYDFSFRSDSTHATTTGFIAQELYPLYPYAVTTNGDNGTVPLGASSTPWQVDYGRITPLIVRAVQQLAHKLDDLATTVASFADHFTTRELSFTRATGDYLTVNHLHAGEACLPKSDGSEVCVTGDQLAALLSQSAAAGFANPSPAAPTNQFANPTPDPAEPPIIEIQGNNPAHINIGDSYNDLGARIAGPTQADTNLGIKTFLNGALVSNIVLDTTAPATNTIDYVVTDQNGLTSTSTRTVIIDAPPLFSDQVAGQSDPSTSESIPVSQ